MGKRSKNKKKKTAEKVDMSHPASVQFEPASSSQSQGQPSLPNLSIPQVVGPPPPLNAELLNSMPPMLQYENPELSLFNFGTSLPNYGAPLPPYYDPTVSENFNFNLK